MTTTLQRLDWLLPVLADFPELGPFAERQPLLALLRSELGSETALEENQITAPARILHLISANTPLAGLQSLLRGLLLGSQNWCKIPSAGLPRFETFIALLPVALAALVETSPTLPEHWLAAADAVIVFGSDDTVAHFRERIRPGQIFAGYGHQWSGAVIFADPVNPAAASLPLLARDIGLYDQLGCLSAQIVFVAETVDPRRFAGKLAAALADYERLHPRRALSVEENQTIASWRQRFAWQAATTGRTALWTSPGSTAWTVVFDASPEIGLTPLFRSVLVKPFAGIPEIGPLSRSLSSLGLWPDTPAHRLAVAGLGAARWCPVGDLQFPPPTWQPDGLPALGRLVTRLNP